MTSTSDMLVPAADATIDEVFDALVDAERYPQWLLGAKVVQIVDRDWPRPGASFEHEVGVGPMTVQDRTTVEDIDPGRRLTLLVRARPFIEAHVAFHVCPQAGGTRLTMTEKPAGWFRLLSPVIAPLVKVRNDRSLQRLAELLAHAPGAVAPG